MLIEITPELFEDAMIYAIQKHRGQRRKGNKRPYILHPISVMSRIFANKVSKNMYMLAIAALLHDVIEDCYETKEERLEGLLEIARLFGPQVAAIVDELTLDKEQYALIGKKEYLAHELNLMSSYAFSIKLCDRLDNVCDMKDMGDVFRAKYVPETWYILNKLDRHLSDSQKSLIEQIKAELGKYEKYNVIEVEVVKNSKNDKSEIYENGKLTGFKG